MNQYLNFSLEGKVALVTGASYGIGFAIASAFAEQGAKICFNDINQELVDKGMAAYAEKGIKAHGYVCDVTDEPAVQAMVATIEKEVGTIDILVNNAGVMDNLLPIAEMEDDVWERLLHINLYSVMYGTRKAVQYFLNHRREGVIINTASLSGLCAGRGGCAYTTSKFGVVGLTKNVAFMYGDAGIRCNAICPGNTQTNIGVGMRQPSQLGMSKATTGYSGATRSGKPEEVAAAAVFLASGEAVFINGETLTIDGGWSAY